MRAAGISALIAVTVVVLAPQAAAKELAPGLTCGDDYTCRNDTGDTYRVTWQAICNTGRSQQATLWVGPHSTEVFRAVCPPLYKPGFTEDFGKWIPGSPLTIDYLDAVVDNDPAALTGG
ncbi:hypothetical protein GFY24_08230 [Nocardia sp. SYP-A9097]|uniref:hypothetical protein n=1 Tax=Nocardia sp. SYP-A9097 TaxID=2663237 RepID=UPI00129C0F0E|nr:hypothetical protein [Nocardia sp. SYP-A9097]MRH87444.1 hypothetical protein [Nocardia sp. SYP-A9097]